MNKRRLSPNSILAGVGVLMLIGITSLAVWLPPLVLDPIRTVQLSASNQSILAEPRPYFRTPGMTGAVDEVIRVPIFLDGSPVSGTLLATDVRYLPTELEVSLDTTAPTLCAAFTSQNHNPVSGQFKIRCTAPSGLRDTQAQPLATLLVKPLRPGGLSMELVGRTQDYAVIFAK
jgi:hypothetical protein